MSAELLRDAINGIDRQLGAGYAAKHPELVSSYMQGLAALEIAQRIKEVGDTIDNRGKLIAQALSNWPEHLRRADEA